MIGQSRSVDLVTSHTLGALVVLWNGPSALRTAISNAEASVARTAANVPTLRTKSEVRDRLFVGIVSIGASDSTASI